MERLQRGCYFVSTDVSTCPDAENLHAERYLNWKTAKVSPKWKLTFSRRGTYAPWNSGVSRLQLSGTGTDQGGQCTNLA
jgi:hypothetical protein